MLNEKFFNHGNINILIDGYNIFTPRDKKHLRDKKNPGILSISIINEHIQRIVGIRNRKICKL